MKSVKTITHYKDLLARAQYFTMTTAREKH